MTWQTMSKRVSALVLAAVLTVTLTLPAAAAEAIGDGVTPTYDEAYYATLDYYGNLLEGSVVKSYAMNGRDSLTDYGVYDEVVNLTDSSVPVSGEGGSTSFQFAGGAPDHFYFEGKTKKPFEDLPWTISLRYTLNGVPAKAEELAGKQGVVEILLDIVPNENAGDYARYNYTLAATALFNQDDILSLEAEGAQVQLVGNLRTVLFLCLPGEEQHFTIRVGSNDFSFGGLTVMMMPATLVQLEEIAKLSERKDDLEEDYRALSGSLDELLDALADIQNGLYASAKGLDQLDAARGTFSGGKGALYSGTDRLREDLSNLADILAPVEQRVQLLSQTVTDSKAVLNEMVDATVTLQAQLTEMETALYGLEQGTSDLRSVIGLAADMEGNLLRLESALGGVHVGGGSVATNSRGLVEKVKNVHGAYAAEDTETFLQKMLEAQGVGSAEAKAKAAGMKQLLDADKAGLPVPPEQQTALEAAKQMETLHQVKQQTNMGFRDFCGQVTKDPDTAKQMNDLWLIYSAGGAVSGKAALRNRPVPEVVVPAVPEPPQAPAEPPEQDRPSEPAETPDLPQSPEAAAPETGAPEEPAVSEEAEQPAPEEEQGPPVPEDAEAPETLKKGQMSARLVVYEALDGDDSGASDQDGASGEDDGSSGSDGSSGDDSPGGSDGSSGDDSPSGNDSPSGDNGSSGDGGSSKPETPGEGDGAPSGPDAPSNPGKPPENDTVGGAVVDLITSGLDSATARIDAIQSQLNASLNQIKRPTAAVAGDLANLCGELNYLLRDLDDAEDLTAALGQSAGTLREILEDVDALRIVLNDYEPTLQEALTSAGTLSASAVTTIRDTETLLSDAENLARSTGRDLDAGTKQSLRGLSAALRQTAKALATTKQVKEAKNTVTQIIEDTWNEYTGDVNNILLMDATAEAVSLTDKRNPSPDSIQVLIRTQEIKTEKAEEDEASAAVKEESTFWGRVTQMFRDFWNAVTGVFH
ncbi:MAG: hypothetical protein HFF99_04540 [Oscillibacter sp.]|nr:hypothetical protein [uncultured Oscillibacter sp.]MCI8970717.1 hypothetical protein [Oscillibacter sp.]